MDSGRDIHDSSNKIRQIRWTIAGMYKVPQNTQFVVDMMLNRQSDCACFHGGEAGANFGGKVE